MVELANEILNIINETTGCKYISPLEISFEDTGKGDVGIYTLALYLNRERIPLVMSIEGDKNKFKQFVKDEIRNRKLEAVGFYSLYRDPTPLEQELYNSDNDGK